MSKWLKRIAMLLAVAFLVFTVINASWLAPEPKGGPRLIAHRGIAQEFDRAGVGRDTCTATRIEPPYHDHLENTVRGARQIALMNAHMIEVDIAPTADGRIAVFHDWTLDCRTDGTGPVRGKTMAELKKLDIGYGYTADGGETYPLRGGPGMGAMPELKELLAALPERTGVMYNFKSGDAREAELLARALREAGRDPAAAGDAFYGHPDPVAAIAEIYPEAWSWSVEGARDCTTDYLLLGWSGYLPDSCRGGTMVIPLNRQWLFWGWPNRLIARMEAHGGRIVVTGPLEGDRPNTGLTLPEQYGEIPDSYNGHIWIDDSWNMVPALFPSRERRSVEEQIAGQEALEARRARQ